MEIYVGIFLSFPVVIFTGLLTLSILYWLFAAIGLFSIDCLDFDFGTDMDFDMYHAEIPSSGLGGVLMKFGFNQVPLTLIITLISLIGFIISYFCHHFFLLPIYEVPWLYYLAGSCTFLIVLIIATFLTAYIIRPIRPLFKQLNSTTHNSLLGQSVVIRSSVVNDIKGEAIYEDGGAGLILQVRCYVPNQFKRNDVVILLSYDSTTNSYQIVSVDEFNGL